MIQSEPPRVQHQPGHPVPLQRPLSVDRIAENRMPQPVGHVHPDLVRPSGMDPALHQGRTTFPRQHLPIRQGNLALRPGHDRHLLAVSRIASDPVLHPAGVPAHRPRDHTEILLASLTGSKSLHQGEVGRIGFRHREAPAGILVEAMNDPGPLRISEAREASAAMFEQPLHQGSGGISRPRMNTKPLRLVQNEKMLILEENLQLHHLTAQRRGIGRSGQDLNPVPHDHGPLWCRRMPVHEDTPFLGQSLQTGSGKAGQPGHQKEVQPFPGTLTVFHLQRDCFSV